MARLDPVAAAKKMESTPPTPAEVRRVLGAIVKELEAVAVRQQVLYDARRVVLHAGRGLDPPMTQVDLAAAAGVAQVQIVRALNRAD